MLEITLDCPLNADKFNHPLTLVISGVPASSDLKIKQGDKSIGYNINEDGILVNVNPRGGRVKVEW